MAYLLQKTQADDGIFNFIACSILQETFLLFCFFLYHFITMYKKQSFPGVTLLKSLVETDLFVQKQHENSRSQSKHSINYKFMSRFRESAYRFERRQRLIDSLSSIHSSLVDWDWLSDKGEEACCRMSESRKYSECPLMDGNARAVLKKRLSFSG